MLTSCQIKLKGSNSIHMPVRKEDERKMRVGEKQLNELHQPHEGMPTEMLLGVSLFSPAENRSSKSRELAGKTQIGGFPLKFRTHWYLKEHHNPGDP
jgi:hypothetical protein